LIYWTHDENLLSLLQIANKVKDVENFMPNTQIFEGTNKFLAWKQLILLQITTHKHTKQIFDLVVAKAPSNRNKSKAQLPLLCKTHDVGRNSSELEFEMKLELL
jgi:hypothetical protein